MKFQINNTVVSRYNMAKLFLTGNFVLIYESGNHRTYRSDKYLIMFERQHEEFVMELQEKQKTYSPYTDHIITNYALIFRVFWNYNDYHKLLVMKHEKNN